MLYQNGGIKSTKTTQIRLCRKCKTGKRAYGLALCRSCKSAEKKEKELRKNEKHKLTKTYQEKLKKKLHDKAWLLQGQKLKSEKANFQGYAECYTCRLIFPVKELQQGHRHHGKLDFDPRNIKLQCVRCNYHLSGNLGEYEHRLIEDNGIEWAKKLKADANQHQGYSVQDLEEIIHSLSLLTSKDIML